MEKIIKNCLAIIKEQKERIQRLESQNSALNTFLSLQTELLINYAYFYQDTADSFLPDINYERLLNSVKHVQLDIKTIQLLEMLKLQKGKEKC